MPSSTTSFEKRNLKARHPYLIEIHFQDKYTPFVRLSHVPTQKTLLTLPIDPTDNTVVGSIANDQWDLDAKETETVLTFLSETLHETLGAKEFIIIPEKNNLPDFKLPEASGFDRLRHGTFEKLFLQTSKTLSEHKPIVTEFDSLYHFVTNEAAVLKNQDIGQRYQEITCVLNNTDFTLSKMEEYKNEELSGKLSRFKNKNVTPIVMLNAKNQIVGLVRSLTMQNHCSYLSDEIINQELCAFERFKGKTEAEQKANRELFLLSYLMHKAIGFLGVGEDNHFLMIAAKGREKVYDNLGFESAPFKLSNLKVMLHLGPQGPELKNLQTQIKELALPTQKPPQPKPNYFWQYGKYGLAALAAGLFAYRLLRPQSEKLEPTFKPTRKME